MNKNAPISGEDVSGSIELYRKQEFLVTIRIYFFKKNWTHRKAFIHHKFVSNILELMSQTFYLKRYFKSVEKVNLWLKFHSIYLSFVLSWKIIIFFFFKE